jgi:hypothetical protein
MLDDDDALDGFVRQREVVRAVEDLARSCLDDPVRNSRWLTFISAHCLFCTIVAAESRFLVRKLFVRPAGRAMMGRSESRGRLFGERPRLVLRNVAEGMAGSTGLEPATSGLTVVGKFRPQRTPANGSSNFQPDPDAFRRSSRLPSVGVYAQNRHSGSQELGGSIPPHQAATPQETENPS